MSQNPLVSMFMKINSPVAILQNLKTSTLSTSISCSHWWRDKHDDVTDKLAASIPQEKIKHNKNRQNIYYIDDTNFVNVCCQWFYVVVVLNAFTAVERNRETQMDVAANQTVQSCRKESEGLIMCLFRVLTIQRLIQQGEGLIYRVKGNNKVVWKLLNTKHTAL